MSQMIIANRLTDGLVVFMTSDARWVEAIADGELIPDKTEGERRLEVARRGELACEIIDPCLIEVEEHAGVRTPTVYREEIRARGPSIQAEAG